MFEDGDRHDIFNPSLSWITKSGVHLEYTPEDTLTSAIFVGGENTLPPEMTYTLTTESCRIIGENKNVNLNAIRKIIFQHQITYSMEIKQIIVLKIRKLLLQVGLSVSLRW
ncbi:Centromere protein [Schistosoma japonicum]|nr:Centromere protein [Schistosoma japonicum]